MNESISTQQALGSGGPRPRSVCEPLRDHSGDAPPLVSDLRHVDAVFVDVPPVLDQLVLKLLLEIGPLGTRLRNE